MRKQLARLKWKWKYKKFNPLYLIAAAFLLLALSLFFTPILLIERAESSNSIVEIVQEDECVIMLTVEGETRQIPLEEYVVGVVAGEMPAIFHPEALKAQAIASRTYVLRLTENGQKPIQPTVEHQVYRSEKERKERWGKSFKENETKVREAVKATKGQVIFYEDKLITAMFFSTSNGMTETAKNYSGNAIPYLNSVESSKEAEIAPNFSNTFEVPLFDWNKALGFEWNDDLFKDLKLIRNASGRVQTMVAGAYTFTGREVRDKLKLPSTDFDIAYDLSNKIVHITTTGYGHGVGMSQYGAEAFAREDWKAEDILTYYYQNTEIKNFPIEEEACLKSS
ncbi:stage II sporulation protein D [Chungangia koreensis]|uniref:Stage II sporulation protein D n=1 Tax=Chungangia koreensis TaxID=752657 RepID=A0ABV8X3Z7_9LACT